MKRKILMTLIALACVSVAFSCKRVEPELSEELPVTFYNTSGTWQLVQWDGKDVEFELILELKDKKFTMTQNVGSMYPVTYTGSYNLITMEDDSVYIRGMYDYTFEFWDSEYIIASLTATHMLWEDKEPGGKSQLFVKK